MTREESIEVYKRCSHKLFNVSLRIVGDSGQAEEIMQDTILKFFRLAGDGTLKVDERNAMGWMVRTCVRASIDALRKRKRERLFFEEYAMAGEEGSLESEDSLELDVQKVKTAIGQLPDSYRIILTLVLIEGLDYGEISRITGAKEGALRTQYSRARKMLVQRLGTIR